MNPNLVDMSKLNNEAEKLIFNNNTFVFNGSMLIFFLFLIALTVVFSYNYSKEKATDNTINKLRYIVQKSDSIMKN